MKKSPRSQGSFWLAACCAALILGACSTTSTSPSAGAGASGAASSGAASPGGGQTAQQVLPNGLHLVSQTPQRLVYLRPGASFAKYDKVTILPCYVAFQKNWQENYNQTIDNLDQMVTDTDVQNMKNALAAQFKQVFTQVLTQGGYPVVQTSAPDVLLLRPAIVNLNVTQPDLLSNNLNGVAVRSAGSATLWLELWDPVSKTILARVVDSEADRQAVAQPMTINTNTQAANTILTQWADELLKHLQAAKAAGKS